MNVQCTLNKHNLNIIITDVEMFYCALRHMHIGVGTRVGRGLPSHHLFCKDRHQHRKYFLFVSLAPIFEKFESDADSEF